MKRTVVFGAVVALLTLQTTLGMAAPGATTLYNPLGTHTSNRPTFKWTAVTGAEWYFVWVGQDGQRVASKWVSTTQWTPDFNLPTGCYAWWVQTYGGAAPGDWSEKGTFCLFTSPVVSMINGVKNESGGNINLYPSAGIGIYPDPTYKLIRIGLAEGGVGPLELQDWTRTISFNAAELNIDEGTVLNLTGGGLEWARDYAFPASIRMLRPDDWNGTSAVVVKIYFFPMTAASGTVDFFLRPNGVNVGEEVTSASSVNADAPVPVGTIRRLKVQTFTLPAETFGSKTIWTISIQNQGIHSTYPDKVAVMCVTVSYTAIR